MATQTHHGLADHSLRIVGKDISDKPGLALSAIMHNEMYFLPKFLEHYRQLGVQKFIILDDQSDDGSFQFANAEPDVMLLQSDHRYGDLLPVDDKRSKRAMIHWRQTLLSRFGGEQWSLHLDLDEFLALPEGMTIQDLTQHLGDKPSVVWAAMIDMYPQYWPDIIRSQPPEIDEVEWYFDARKHLFLGANYLPTPIALYSGVRARLREEYGLRKGIERKRKRIERAVLGNPYPRMGRLYKPVLINWHDKFSFHGSHVIRKAKQHNLLLPLAHYKFAPDFVSRFEYAIETQGYFGKSRSYTELKALYELMRAENTSFLGPDPKRFTRYQDFYDAGITKGLNPQGEFE